MTHPGIAEIINKYKAYNSNVFEVYEDYNFVDFYLPHVHKLIKNDKLPCMDFFFNYN